MEKNLPLASMEKTLKKAGAKRVSEAAKKQLQETLKKKIKELTEKATAFSKHSKRKTIKEEDIHISTEK